MKQMSPVEVHLRNRISDLKFMPFKKADTPTMIGFISYTYDQVHTMKSIGLHMDNRGYWASWPYWDTEKTGERHFYNKPVSDDLELAYVRIFVEAMDKHIAATKRPNTQKIVIHSLDRVEDPFVITEKEPEKPRMSTEKPKNTEGLVVVRSFTRRYPNR